MDIRVALRHPDRIGRVWVFLILLFPFVLVLILIFVAMIGFIWGIVAAVLIELTEGFALLDSSRLDRTQILLGFPGNRGSGSDIKILPI